MACKSCGAYLIGTTYVREKNPPGPFRFCSECGAPMGRLERPRFGVPDDSWQVEFKKAFVTDDYPRALAILRKAVEHTSPKALALLGYIDRLGEETDREDDAWVDLSDLPLAYGETIRWTISFHLAISLLQNVAAIALRKLDQIDEPNYSTDEELADFIGTLVKMKGFEEARDQIIAISFDSAASAKRIVEQLYKEATSALDKSDPIPALLDLDVETLSYDLNQLRMTQMVLQEVARSTTAS